MGKRKESGGLSERQPMTKEQRDEFIELLRRDAERATPILQHRREIEERERQSLTLRQEILKGLMAGKSHKEILLLAVECIGLMTADDSFAAAGRNLIGNGG